MPYTEGTLITCIIVYTKIVYFQMDGSDQQCYKFCKKNQVVQQNGQFTTLNFHLQLNMECWPDVVDLHIEHGPDAVDLNIEHWPNAVDLNIEHWANLQGRSD